MRLELSSSFEELASFCGVSEAEVLYADP